jgi:hypothetical protein
MRFITSLVLISALALVPAIARAQQQLPPGVEAEAFKRLASGIPLGSRIKLQTRDGRRLTATLMAINDDDIVVKRESRVPEPAVSLAFSELTRLQLDKRDGFSMGKAIGIGLAAGVGAILTLFAIAVSLND